MVFRDVTKLQVSFRTGIWTPYLLAPHSSCPVLRRLLYHLTPSLLSMETWSCLARELEPTADSRQGCGVHKGREAVSMAMINRVGPVRDGLLEEVYLGVGIGILYDRF